MLEKAPLPSYDLCPCPHYPWKARGSEGRGKGKRRESGKRGKEGSEGTRGNTVRQVKFDEEGRRELGKWLVKVKRGKEGKDKGKGRKGRGKML